MDHASLVPRSMSFHLLEEMTKGFCEEQERGSGAYGKVYEGVHQDGTKIAVKVLHDMLGLDDKQFIKEFENLARLKHENIVQLVGYCNETQQMYVQHNGGYIFASKIHRALCFEYMHNGSLDKYLSDESTGHDWGTRYGIIKGICMGLKYLHEELETPMYHLDLKPANVLIDKNMVPKIADFGLSRLFGGEQTQVTRSPIGTPGYAPPEYIDAAVISIKFDIFSLGVVIIKIMTGPNGYFRSAELSSQEFIERVHAKWRNRLQATSLYHLESCSEQVKRCIEIGLSCVEADRHKRPSIGDIVNQLEEMKTSDELLDVHPLQIHFPFGEAMSSEVRQANKLSIINQSSPPPQVLLQNELLDVYPLLLRFPFEPDVLISCPLRLTNNTDHHVAFSCIPKTPQSYSERGHHVALSQLRGILLPRSTCTYLLTMEEKQQPPQANTDTLDLVLKSCVGHKGMQGKDVDDSFFMQAREESPRKVYETTLTAVCEPASETMSSEPIQPRIKVKSSYITNYGDAFVMSIDVHPTEPWILMGQRRGYVSIWDYQTRATVMLVLIGESHPVPGYLVDYPSVGSAKFIARMGWFVAGDAEGYIHVQSYKTMKMAKKIKAHMDSVNSLAVHPSHPYVLSASDDHLIKLWNWEADWACIYKFKGHSHKVNQVMFNPQNGDTFASASNDGTVKIWNTLPHLRKKNIWNTSYLDCITKLDCQSNGQICVGYFSTGDDQQYIITGSLDGTAHFWDLQTNTCIRRLDGLQKDYGCNVGVVDCLLDYPTLITVSHDKAVSLLNSTTYRLESIVHFNLGQVNSFAYIKSIRSLAIACDYGVAIMELN